MRIDRLIRTLFAEPWLIEPRTLAAGVQVLHRKLLGESFLGTDLHAELDVSMPEAAARRRSAAREPRLAVVPILGIIEQRGMSSLGTSAQAIEYEFDTALKNSDVDGILLDIDSPGGTVTGIPELAARIRAARQQKPVLAIANGMAASAAYWLGSAAKEFWSIPSGEAGSIGVYMLHVDQSKHLEQEGFAVEALSAGKFKLEGAPWGPLSDEGKEFYTGEVDRLYGWFVKDVASNRGDSQANVRAGYGEGRVLGADAALASKLVDRVGTFDEAVGRLVQLATRSRERRAARARAIELESARLT
jgi:signal peptide peptidase SppA